MEEAITAEVYANYDDRDPKNNITVNWDDDRPDTIWFNITLSDKRDGDYITVSVKIKDILHAIGKVITEE